MDSEIIYRQYKNAFQIEIKPHYKSIVKFGIWFFYTTPFLILILAGIYVIGERPELIFEPGINQLIILGFLLFSVFIIRAFLKKLYRKEVIVVTGKHIMLIDKFFMSSNKQRFDKNKINDLKYVGREDFTEHHLATKGFDYLGFGTAEKEVQFFIEDGSIVFNYNGKLIRFGRGLWDEDAQIIIENILK